MTCLSKMTGYHMLPEELQCTLALILQVSEILLVGRKNILLKIIPLFCALMMVVESAVKTRQSKISVPLG